MPRSPRLDAPGALHHVIARGIERTAIFRDSTDAESFVARLERRVAARAWRIYAWALMPNHVHLLVRTEDAPLAASMRSILTGHAVTFNRRHGRVGHLFQNRYRSILCEDDAYFLELVRYIHLNPVRAGLVDPAALDDHPYTGHAALVGRASRSWQATDEVLAEFGDAVARYRRFVFSGVPTERRPELVSGRILRRPDGWSASERAPRRGRDANRDHERVLGRRAFRAELRRELDATAVAAATLPSRMLPAALIRRAALRYGIHSSAIVRGKGVRARAARAFACFVWIEMFGASGSDLARQLGVSRASVYRSALRGRRDFDPLAISRAISEPCDTK